MDANILSFLELFYFNLEIYLNDLFISEWNVVKTGIVQKSFHFTHKQKAIQ